GSIRRFIRDARAVASALLADNKQEANPRLAGMPQPVGGGDLRGEDALRIAGAASVEAIAVNAARKERRNAVEVCGEDDGRSADSGDDVEPGRIDRLLG